MNELFEDIEILAGSGDVAVLIDGKMKLNGEKWIPPLGDKRGIDCLRASEKARKGVRITPSERCESKTWHIHLAISCPYCGTRLSGKGIHRVKSTARAEAEAILGQECRCGADWSVDGNSCKQTNQ